MQTSASIRPYVGRVLIALALGAGFLLAWHLSGLLLVVFGAVVIAVMLDAAASPLTRYLPLPHGVALALAVTVMAAVLTLLVWLFGAQLAGELGALREALPDAWARFQEWLATSPAGPVVLQVAEQARASATGLVAKAGTLAMSASGNVTYLLLMVAGGIYLAAQPRLYRDGLLKLFPADRRPLMGDALDASGSALRYWLLGQLVTMVVVGLLTGMGLWLLGVPGALGLGIITMLLDFVPFVGPVAAGIPAVLLGFTVSPEVGLGSLVLFTAVQQLESHVLQPLIQQRVVSLPPAVLLVSLFASGLLFGVLGVILAAPLTVVVFVLVKRLYVREALQTFTHVPGEHRPPDPQE